MAKNNCTTLAKFDKEREGLNDKGIEMDRLPKFTC